MLTISVFANALEGTYVLFISVADEIALVGKWGVFYTVQKIIYKCYKSTFIEWIFKSLSNNSLSLLSVHLPLPLGKVSANFFSLEEADKNNRIAG